MGQRASFPHGKALVRRLEVARTKFLGENHPDGASELIPQARATSLRICTLYKYSSAGLGVPWFRQRRGLVVR